MKILIVTQYFWPESFRINDLALGLTERGHEVTVYTGMPNYPTGRFFRGYGFLRPHREFFGEIPVLRVPLLPRGQGRRWRLGLNFFSFAFFASLLAPFRCKGDFDAIFIYEPSPITVAIPGLVLKKWKRVPILLWVQDLWPESLQAAGGMRSTWLLMVVKQLVRIIYRGCDHILVQSEGFIPYVTAMGGQHEKVVYFPNWAEEFYQPVALPEFAPERGELPSGFRIVFAGNIGMAQSFETLLSAAELLKSHTDIHWVIFGDGHRRAWVEEQILARGLKDSVHLLGSRPSEAMPRYFALADVLLVLLRKDPIFASTIPSKIQSYMACGRPIIASLEGSGADVIRKGGAGLVCEPGDSVSLGNTVMAMYRMTHLERAVMADHARRYYKQHFERDMLLNRLEVILGAQGQTLNDRKVSGCVF